MQAQLGFRQCALRGASPRLVARRSAAALRPLRAVPGDEPAPSDSAPQRLGSAGPKLDGPKLLPRPVRSKKGGGGGGGGGSGGGGSPRALASLAAYTGLVGTAAVVLGKAAGVDVWSAFRWAPEDLTLALQLMVPLQLLNAALLLPSYSSWRLPTLANLEAMEAGLKREAEQKLPLAASTQQAGAAPAAPAAAVAANAAVALGAAGAPPAPEAEPSTPRGAVPAAAWGSGSRSGEGEDGGEDEQLPFGLSGVRDALHLAQGYYLSNNPTARLSPLAEATFSAVDTAAGEMLYRGVALTWLASWLEDRVYEGGLDELLTSQLPAAAAALGPRPLPQLDLYGSCECAVAAGIVAFVVWSVLYRAQRTTRKLSLLLEPIAHSSGKAAGTKGDAAAQAGGGKAGGGGGGGKEGEGDAAARMTVQLLMGAGSPSTGPAGAIDVLQRAAAIQAVRDATQIALINGIFIATGGNLAASFTAAFANQVLISAMQRRGMRRLRERSAVLARELKVYNTELQRIIRKYKGPAAQAAALAAATAASDSATSSAGGEQAAPASAHAHSSEAAVSSSGSSSDSNHPTELPRHVPVAGGAADASGPSGHAVLLAPVAAGAHAPGAAAACAAPAAEASGAGAAEATAGAVPSKASASELSRALAALNMLIPEPPAPAGKDVPAKSSRP